MTLKQFRMMAICAALFLLSTALVVGSDSTINPAGRPKQFEQGKKTAVAVWEEDGVWHIRTSVKAAANGQGQRIQFIGSVQVKGDKITNGEFKGLEKKAKPKNANKADGLVPYQAGNGFDFQFSTVTTDTDGISFKLGPKAESISFRLTVAGDNDPKRIFIGAKGEHPEKNEFTLPVKK